MLSVLAFKRSLSAGILDAGQSEISLGGSRLSRFTGKVEDVMTPSLHGNTDERVRLALDELKGRLPW